MFKAAPTVFAVVKLTNDVFRISETEIPPPEFPPRGGIASIPINIPTQGLPESFQSVGVVNVDDKIFEIVIPLDTEVKKKDGKKVECKTKVFPGYVLINMTLTDETFNFIRSTPGVTSFVSVNNKPVAMKDAEVKRILETLDPEKTVKPKKKWMKDFMK